VVVGVVDEVVAVVEVAVVVDERLVVVASAEADVRSSTRLETTHESATLVATIA
jgi:hypothetical protein